MQIPSRSSGVLLHITSLPGHHGIGDFGPDAYRFVDWLQAAGQHLWQWLPTTPIGPGNSPYQSVSAFAGSPLMLALEPMVTQGWLAAPSLPESGFSEQRADFSSVVPWRMACLREAEQGFRARGTPAEMTRFAAWCADHASWLDDYSLFMALETAHCGQAWWHWEGALRRRQTEALKAARTVHAAEIGFWQFVQWCFAEQLESLKRYANERQIALVGDLPIFVAHHSADVWARPDLYQLDDDDQTQVVAGVPPDAMGPDGQRWGNPLYRWDRMSAEGFEWWIARIRHALHQADVFRIDHFRGFAQYYEIPASSPNARQGRWVDGPGKALFAAIEKALGKLPIIAEDLGFITPDVLELRDAFEFPGMKILQFGFGTDGKDEFLPHNYSPRTVVYTGTHDNDTAHGWWNAAPEEVRAYAATYLATNPADVHWAMIRAASNSVSAMAVFPLQDVLGLDSAHRMNIPGTSKDNWEWRFSWDMVGSESTRVLGLITAASGRGPFDRLGRQ